MEKLYENLKKTQNSLINLYESSGFIRFDIATGLAYYDENNNILQRVKFIKQFDENGNLIPLLKKVIDFDSIKEFNQKNGIKSGSMMDALIQRGSKKVIELYADDYCLRWGTILLGTTECLLKIKDDINFVPYDLMPIYKTSDNKEKYIYDEDTTGLVHSLENKIETYALYERGKYKSYNYKGDADFLTNPISLWAHTDISRLSTSIFGSNSLIRMWGNNQLLDLCGHELSIMENTNIVAGFSNIVNLSDGHFDDLSTRGCYNTFIYNSDVNNIGRLSRSNHFGIIGNKCKNILIENIHIGEEIAKNKGPYFASAIFNTSSSIILKNVIQEQLNHNLTRSGLGLNWYSDLTITEIILGKNIRSQEWNLYKDLYKWLKWEKCDDKNYFNNGMKTIYPEVKTIDELSNDMHIDDAKRVYEYINNALNAYHASSKNADDQGIQIDILHNKNAEPLTNGKLLNGNQVSRTTNLVVANALNRTEMNMYPDSTSYGFRAGNTGKGVANLAKNKSDDYNYINSDIYLIDCIFNELSVSLIESVNILNDNGFLSCLNDNNLKLFGHSNNRNPSAGIACSTMFLSCEKLNKLFNNQGPSSLPYKILKQNSDEYALDTAKMAFNNLNENSKKTWITSENIQGLYKGNDIIEHSMAIITLMSMLQKVYPNSSHFLKNINNSHLDVGILAWRKTMLKALNASTASNIGLKGGYLGDISDYNSGQSTENTFFEGEIYPWFYSNKYINIIKYDILINNCSTKITFINKFHNLNIGDMIKINLNNNIILRKVIKVISSTKIIVEKIKEYFDENKIYELEFKSNYKVPSIIIDKDSDYFNACDKENHLRETVKKAYIATCLPENSDNILKLKLDLIDKKNPEKGTYLSLVRSLSEKNVTYRECAKIMGFEDVGKNKINNLDEYIYYSTSENIDGQNHSHKGAFGIRIDQIKDIGIYNCKITNIESVGFAQETNIIGNNNTLLQNDILQEWRKGTRINDIHGISINGCINTKIDKIENNNFSTLGNIYGLEINGESDNIDVNNINNNNFIAGIIYNGDSIVDPFHLSNKKVNYKSFPSQEAYGLNITHKNNTNCEINNIITNNISSPENNDGNIFIK